MFRLEAAPLLILILVHWVESVTRIPSMIQKRQTGIGRGDWFWHKKEGAKRDVSRDEKELDSLQRGIERRKERQSRKGRERKMEDRSQMQSNPQDTHPGNKVSLCIPIHQPTLFKNSKEGNYIVIISGYHWHNRGNRFDDGRRGRWQQEKKHRKASQQEKNWEWRKTRISKRRDGRILPCALESQLESFFSFTSHITPTEQEIQATAEEREARHIILRGESDVASMLEQQEPMRTGVASFSLPFCCCCLSTLVSSSLTRERDERKILCSLFPPFPKIHSHLAVQRLFSQ